MFKQKQSKTELVIEFIKLQLAGNVLFWGTYIGFPIFHEVLGWPSLWALATASFIGNILFFIIDKKWVFVDKTGRRRTKTEVVRFCIFMGINFFINLAVVEGLRHYYGISEYIGQFVAAAFFTIWNYIGLKFWVFGISIPQAIKLFRKELREHVDKREANKSAKRTT